MGLVIMILRCLKNVLEDSGRCYPRLLVGQHQALGNKCLSWYRYSGFSFGSTAAAFQEILSQDKHNYVKPPCWTVTHFIENFHNAVV